MSSGQFCCQISYEQTFYFQALGLLKLQGRGCDLPMCSLLAQSSDCEDTSVCSKSLGFGLAESKLWPPLISSGQLVGSFLSEPPHPGVAALASRAVPKPLPGDIRSSAQLRAWCSTERAHLYRDVLEAGQESGEWFLCHAWKRSSTVCMSAVSEASLVAGSEGSAVVGGTCLLWM